MTHQIKTAVFPVGGMGTRFLPITKSLPKEMLPILDKPLIQYVVEEVVAAGIKTLVFVTNYTKRALEDYFDTNFELETRLQQRGKHTQLKKIQSILPEDVKVVYVRQKSPLGLGHAILCAKHVVGDEPFIVSLADDVLSRGVESLSNMIDCYHRTQSSVIAVEKVPMSRVDQYGIVEYDEDSGLIQTIVEKPAPSMAPSNMGVVGRYVLTPEIFSLLQTLKPGTGGEIQLTDAIAQLMKTQDITATPILGQRYDCGSREGMLQATIAFALKDDALRPYIKTALKTREIV